ncbi:hypothetical protein E3U23_07115 [Erythrobacter litoralis]|uniref:hypothetical protein n=1 Tax=Erythrobacter litoralis TaxID=39960 RepID=UPI002435A995|nr:hypothetical protein [Erythrobacter litoralis]MDG6078960.1 hypothetical protein [Erythrobacter litoralis]
MNASKVVVAEVVTVTRDNSATFAHLGISFANGSVTTSDPAIPPRAAGRWSARNLDGWEDKRRDLAKETREISHFAPSWRGSGSHLSSRTIEAFPVDYHPARMHSVSAKVLEPLRDGALVRIRIDQPLDRSDPEFDRDLQFNLRLLKELVGSASIFDADLSDEDYAAIQRVDWELLPPGKRDEVLARMFTSKTSDPERMRVASERLEALTKLGPSELILGKGRFSNYFGGRFGSDLVALENLEYGNALYLFEEDWEKLSQLSRSELIRRRDPTVTRVPHVTGWQSLVCKMLRATPRT